MKHLSLMVLLFSTSVFAEQMTLEQTVRYALANSPVFDNAEKTQTITEVQYRKAWAKLLPSVDFTTTDGLQNNIPISGSNIVATNPTAPWYSTLNLGASETLYDNGVSLTGLNIADLNRDIAKLNFAKARDDLTLSIVTEFYKYSLATMLREVQMQQQVILQKQFRTLSSQYLQGFKMRSDYLRLKIQVQQSEIDRVTAENAVHQSVANLQKLVGLEKKDTDSAMFTPVTVERAQKLDASVPEHAPPTENFYDFRIFKMQENVNQLAVRLAERNYWPQITLTSGIAYSNLNYLNSNLPFNANRTLNWDALVTLNFNLWDWGSRRNDVQIAELNRDVQNDNLKQNLLGISSSVNALMADMGRAKESYKLSSELLTMQEEADRELELQYREGKVTYLDLITGLNNLLSSKNQFYTAYFDVLTNLAHYRYYEGNLYATIVNK